MRQRWPEPETSTRGFTIIELLVTLFVAAMFLIASYQLYIVVLRADGQTKAQTIAQNTAQDYLERYRTSVPSPCVASQPLGDSPITVQNLVNVTISVTVSCPKTGSISTLSKIDVALKYGNPMKQIAFSAQVTGLSGPITHALVLAGPAGQTGEVVKPLIVSGNTVSGVWSAADAGRPLKSSDLDALRHNGLYLEIRTDAHPQGELRGQL